MACTSGLKNSVPSSERKTIQFQFSQDLPTGLTLRLCLFTAKHLSLPNVIIGSSSATWYTKYSAKLKVRTIRLVWVIILTYIYNNDCCTSLNEGDFETDRQNQGTSGKLIPVLRQGTTDIKNPIPYLIS